MKQLDRKASQADQIRTINAILEQRDLMEKRLDNIEAMVNDLNNTIIEMLVASGMEVEKVTLDS